MISFRENQPLKTALIGDFHAHLLGSAFKLANNRIDAVGVHVLALDFGDFRELLAGNLTHLLRLGNRRAFVDACRFHDQEGAGRTLEIKLERPIGENGDFCRDDLTETAGGAGVVFLAERHQVDAMLRQRRTNRGCGVCLACVDLQGDDCFDFLCHCFTPCGLADVRASRNILPRTKISSD